MKSISKILVALTMVLSTAACTAQIKNATTETVKVYGNCGMCETTIEKAGKLKNVSKVDWNKDTKMATITYDAGKTNKDAILKKIALAGYDSDNYLAPDAVYNKLPGCCQYDRASKPAVSAKLEMPKVEDKLTPTTTANNAENMLQPVYNAYFALKDALVKTDNNLANAKGKDLLMAITAVKMEKLTTVAHNVWMKVINDLKTDAAHINESKDVAHQRDHFTTLSKNIYALIKVAKPTETVYYDNCPMYNDGKGANWLSKESSIKNPYYGSMMLSCGKTIETIK